MNLPKRGLAGLKENWRKDLFSGFVVSLIALPLGLGLAIASGAPPIAGIITAIVGSVVVALLGGSFVTITGPGNGLAVATIAAVELLGAGNMNQGWLFTMAAIVMSGVIIFLLGLLRFGSLSDFFPSVAVEGMLGAIGLIIMARQLHIMLGFTPESSSTSTYLLQLPETIRWLFVDGSWFVAAIGLGSLAIMVGYAKIRNRFFHLIPAPMWIVLLSILLSYSLQWNNLTDWIPESMRISIPQNLFAEYQLPDFSLLATGDFWVAVITLTLIASIESLLSIKGIERLDNFKRKANTNKDLRAHGLATSLSGFLGGLNVVTVIARSSVNVNNGARTRYANLFHGLILALIIFFLGDLVERIPLPALAAILVYTGYKLVSPRNIKHITTMGWEATTVYAVTFIFTLVRGIIPGIVIGIVITFILQLITTKRPGLILRNIFRPNTLLFTEDDGTFVLSVKRYANFLNFSRIRSKMDSIPKGANVIVDFSLSEFIDNSVMEQISTYHEMQERKGGSVEIVGLDNLESTSDHPFAPWVPIVGNKPKKKKVLSKRQKNIRAYAEELNMQFFTPAKTNGHHLKQFGYFRTKTIDALRTEMAGKVGETHLKMIDVDFHFGEFIARESVHATFVTLDVNHNLPPFVLHEEGFIDRLTQIAGFTDINFENHPEFSRQFFLRSPKPNEVKSYFDAQLIQFFEAHKPYNIESKNGRLLIFEKERVAGINEIKGMVNFAVRLAELIQAQSKK